MGSPRATSLLLGSLPQQTWEGVRLGVKPEPQELRADQRGAGSDPGRPRWGLGVRKARTAVGGFEPLFTTLPCPQEDSS